MNPYDKFPLPPDQHKKMRFWASIALAAWILFCIVLVFSGCAEKDPPPTLEEQLQGAWARQWLNLTNTYNFHAGACDRYSIIGGQPYQYYAYAYTCEGDTLTMLDLAGGFKRRAVVSFSDGGDTAVLGWIGGIDYVLTRI